MKVLYLTNIPAPYRTRFFNHLGERCDLTVLYERSQARDREADWLREAVKSFCAVFPGGIPVGNEAALNPGALGHLSRRTYDVIVVGGYSTPTGMLATQWLRLRRIPYLLNVDGGMIKPDSGRKRWLKEQLMGRAAGYLASGAGSEAYLRHYGAKAPIWRYPFTSLERSDLLPAPPSPAEKRERKQQLGLPEGPMILSVGQFIPRKGFDLLLRAMETVQGSPTLCIVGGKPGQDYWDLAQGLEQIRFLDFMDKSALSGYYRAADLFVLPTREDIWGLVVNEAMAHGLPVITTDHCVAGKELVRPGENGLLVPAGEIAPLAEAVNRLLQDFSLRESMGLQALKTIKGWTLEDMAERHMEIFEEFLQREKTMSGR